MAGALSPADPAPAGALRAELLAWYGRARRDLPWRAAPGERPDPWHVLVSEPMLQQTTVATVRGRFRPFLDRFPTLASLAAAPLDDVLHAWQGLGYYRRARSLHACAQAVMARHAGRLPLSEAALLELPGIGPYTAAAIAAILAGVLVFSAINSARDGVTVGPSTVLVANQLIPKGSTAEAISEGNLFKPASVASDSAVSGAVTDVSQLQGKVATADIYPGQQLSLSRFTAAGGAMVAAPAAAATGPHLHGGTGARWWRISARTARARSPSLGGTPAPPPTPGPPPAPAAPAPPPAPSRSGSGSPRS